MVSMASMCATESFPSPHQMRRNNSSRRQTESAGCREQTCPPPVHPFHPARLIIDGPNARRQHGLRRRCNHNLPAVAINEVHHAHIPAVPT